MNRSWFRLPFGGGSSSSAQADDDDDDELELSHDAGEILPSASSSRSYGRRSKASNSSNCKRRPMNLKSTIGRPSLQPSLGTHSDTASYATARGSSVPSETSGSSGTAGEDAGERTIARSQRIDATRAVEHDPVVQHHASKPSLQSISSIRTTHFAARTDFERLQRSTTPDGSMEVSPSKTPLRDRLNRLSVASTASGMVNFDDGDREEAERRWLEDEDEEAQAEEARDGQTEPTNGVDGIESEESSDSGSENDEDRRQRMSVITPSRSSTSLKSILKKSVASAEGIQPCSSLPEHATPRTVTWSPSTHAGAASPPPVDVTPEHPRGPLAAAEAYLLNLGQRQQNEYYQGDRPSYNQEEDSEEEECNDRASTEGSDSSAVEIEEALLSRSSTSISPHNLSAASLVEANEASADSIRQQGSTSKRGAAFMDRMQEFIPSPDASFEDTKHASSAGKCASQKTVSMMDASVSNILDVSAPSQSVLNEITVNDDRSRHNAMKQGAHRPFLLRQSVIVEESAEMGQSGSDDRSHEATRNKLSLGAATSPDKSYATSNGLAGQSFFTAPYDPLPAASIRTPPVQTMRLQQEQPTNSPLLHQGGQSTFAEIESSVHDAFLTPLKDNDSEDIGHQAYTSPSQSLKALPVVTPSSSSSSITKLKSESPFTSLVNHLLSTQDELLSHRADQKTMLISLVTNLRGELASRDRLLDALESQKKKLDIDLRNERKAREQDQTQYKQRATVAMSEVEHIKDKLSKEIKRRDDALREELLHERAKREMAEKQLESLRKTNSASEELEYLRTQVGEAHEAADAERQQKEDIARRFEETNSDFRDVQQQRTKLEDDLLQMQTRLEKAQTEVTERSQECNRLRKDAVSADKQMAKMSNAFEAQLQTLRMDLGQADAQVGRLNRQLEEKDAALQQERLESTRLHDVTTSLQTSLQVDNDRLSSNVAQLERAKERSFQQLQVIKKDMSTVLAQKEERIVQLEADLMKRSLDRRNVGDTGCSTCKDAAERTSFLESEVVRLREAMGKMRMESADREVKVARLVKAREQLKDDIDGLNIALQAKQQEVLMLKRETNRQSGDGSSHHIQNAAASARNPLRVLHGQRASMHESAGDAASSTFTANQRRRSLKTRSTVNKRMSGQRNSIDTPGVLASLNANNTTSNQLQAAVSARRNDQTASHDKALEAASLIKPAAVTASHTAALASDKENRGSQTGTRSPMARMLRDLPSAPSHSISTNMRATGTRSRSSSVVAVEAR